ncbi:hypothetical protein ACTFBT_12965 [Streptomyces microflavus]|uniref:hypothetical protein n=1 Tax=Streptomyces TaxID=1883 RepID=UPI00131A56CB|nr:MULTISPECIES: hypothetical protein [Streptomyces]MDX2977087.1 hypothetical protein [Streptomyces sp. NRRL_B-2249]WSA60732.1 hypothetical protein OHB31_11350 [Streptomyces microflavus]WSS36610.1 hypothetical protein OG269_25635 [Streptomyces microflavus]WST14867.1 hypothetical protein OG721_13145 [Streptomyces microflavus]
MVTNNPSGPWWAALAALVLFGVLPQIYLYRGTSPQNRPPVVNAAGTGAVAVGGSSYERISTKVVGVAIAEDETAGQGVSATGAGAVAVGEAAIGTIETDVAHGSGGAS